MKNIKITNNERLPELFVKAVENIVCKDYSGYRSDVFMSATGLLKPAYQIALERDIEKQGIVIPVEAADYVWMLFGSAVHYVIEKASQDNRDVFTEETMTVTIPGVDEKISGTPDYFDIVTKVIHDFKITSVWTMVYGSRFEDWEKQLNIYAYLFRRHGIEPSGLNIIALFKDWKKNEARNQIDRQSDSLYKYPQYPVKSIPISKLWEFEQQEKFIADRITEIKKHLHNFKDMTGCTPDEKWQKVDTYTVMKEGRKSAVRVLDTQTEAERYIESEKPSGKISIVKRPGECIRCNDYCIVADYCKFRGVQ